MLCHFSFDTQDRCCYTVGIKKRLLITECDLEPALNWSNLASTSRSLGDIRRRLLQVAIRLYSLVLGTRPCRFSLAIYCDHLPAQIFPQGTQKTGSNGYVANQKCEYLFADIAIFQRLNLDRCMIGPFVLNYWPHVGAYGWHPLPNQLALPVD
jgi:hypothetical protein